MDVKGDYEPSDAAGFIKINAVRFVNFNLFYRNIFKEF